MSATPIHTLSKFAFVALSIPLFSFTSFPQAWGQVNTAGSNSLTDAQRQRVEAARSRTLTNLRRRQVEAIRTRNIADPEEANPSIFLSRTQARRQRQLEAALGPLRVDTEERASSARFPFRQKFSDPYRQNVYSPPPSRPSGALGETGKTNCSTEREDIWRTIQTRS